PHSCNVERPEMGLGRPWLQHLPYWLLLLPLSKSGSEVLCATRLCLFLARCEIFGPTWLLLLVAWRQIHLARRGARFRVRCDLRGGWKCKECSSNRDRYHAFHYQLLFSCPHS